MNRSHRTTDAVRNAGDPTKIGSPAHFAAFARRAGLSKNTVIVPEGIRVEGFRVPRDGVWMINKRFVMAGEELTLLPGHTVTYYVVDQHEDDDRPAALVGMADDAAVARSTIRAGRFDPLSGRFVQQPVDLVRHNLIAERKSRLKKS